MPRASNLRFPQCLIYSAHYRDDNLRNSYFLDRNTQNSRFCLLYYDKPCTRVHALMSWPHNARLAYLAGQAKLCTQGTMRLALQAGHATCCASCLVGLDSSHCKPSSAKKKNLPAKAGHARRCAPRLPSWLYMTLREFASCLVRHGS